MGFQENQSYFCCGLREIGNFGGAGQNSIREDHDSARFATTVHGQTAAIKSLRRMGFKVIAKWKRDEGYTIKLWFRPPNTKKRQYAQVSGR